MTGVYWPIWITAMICVWAMLMTAFLIGRRQTRAVKEMGRMLNGVDMYAWTDDLHKIFDSLNASAKADHLLVKRLLNGTWILLAPCMALAFAQMLVKL